MNPNAFPKKVAKKLLDIGFGSYVAANRLIGRIDYPVPSFSGMHKTSSKTIRHYYESGIRTAMPIITSAINLGVQFEGLRILDFGCGVGRQLVQFTRHLPNNHYFGCDIDHTAIAYIHKCFPQVDAYASKFLPPLEYDDASFDIIYSVSIFSHLHEDQLRPWLDELARITKPGGYLFLTTEGTTALEPLADAFGASPQQLQEQLQKDGILYKEYDQLAELLQSRDQLDASSLHIGIDGSYGNTVLSKDYVLRTWSDEKLQVINVLDGVIDFRQDLVILKRL